MKDHEEQLAFAVADPPPEPEKPPKKPRAQTLPGRRFPAWLWAKIRKKTAREKPPPDPRLDLTGNIRAPRRD